MRNTIISIIERRRAIAARASRQGRQPVALDLDVFGPDGNRAVKIMPPRTVKNANRS